MDFTHCWSLLHHSSSPHSISTSYGLPQSLHITLIISTSHGLPGCRKLTMFESPPPMDLRIMGTRYIEPTPPKTSYGLLILLIIHTSSINISWNLRLPWTSTVSPHNLVILWSPPLMDYHTAESWLCLNLHLPWTTVHSAEGIAYWICTSNDLLWTSPIVDHCYIIHHYLFQSPPPPPMDFYNLSI